MQNIGMLPGSFEDKFIPIEAEWKQRLTNCIQFANESGYPYHVSIEDGPHVDVGLECFYNSEFSIGEDDKKHHYCISPDEKILRFYIIDANPKDGKMWDYYLYAFSDHRQAVMFKLTYGGDVDI